MSKQDYFRRSLTSKKVLLLSKKDLKSNQKYFTRVRLIKRFLFCKYIHLMSFNA